jgi:hypothetical protein
MRLASGGAPSTLNRIIRSTCPMYTGIPQRSHSGLFLGRRPFGPWHGRHSVTQLSSEYGPSGTIR